MARGTEVSADVRRRNAALVYQSLLESSPCSRKDLRAATGLVSGTVTAIVGDLEARGLVRETGEVVATGGRPQRLIEAAPERVAGVTATLSSTEVDVRVVDLAGHELWSERRQHAATTASIVPVLEALLGDAWQTVTVTPGVWNPGAVLAVPGLVRDDRSVMTSLELPELDGFDLVDAVCAAGVYPRPLRLLNSGRTAALAEWAAQPQPQRPTMMAYIDFGPRGVSGGIVDHGTLFGGEHGLAGEVGHIVVEADGRRCDCGARGCLSTVLALENLMEHAGLESALVTAAPDAGLAQLVSALRAGDARARAAVERAARGVAAAVATLSNLVDAGVVVLGGNFGSLWEWIGGPVEEVLAEREQVSSVFNPTLRQGMPMVEALQVGLRQAIANQVLGDPLQVPVMDVRRET